jgi:hypothetical protein
MTSTITANLIGPIRLTSALIERLKKQANAAAVYNTSALAFVPLALTGVYSSTKAALHSYDFVEVLHFRHGSGTRRRLCLPGAKFDILAPVMKFIAFAALALSASTLAQQPPPPAGVSPAPTQPAGRGGRGGRGAPPIQPKPEELAQIKSKAEQIESLVNPLKAKHADADLIGDVEVYAKAGRFLLEFPELFGTQAAVDHAITVMDQGIARARQLQNGESPWTTGKKQIHAYYSAVDGSVQPYAITLPENYDPAKPARLYVWMHGRQNNTTESEFIFSQQTFRPGNVPVADQGQIQLDLFGRINSAGWHWAGEADVFEAIAAVQKRFKIDDKRILLRGFSMGGEGAWHIALHYPDRFAAAEIGAGTWSRRSQTPGLQPYQYATLKIWENMEEWALNAFNLPLAGHDGDTDTQIASLPGPPPGTPNRGQLES